jgi:hypothetical protein
MEDLADSFPVVGGMLVIQTSIDKHIFKALFRVHYLRGRLPL